MQGLIEKETSGYSYQNIDKLSKDQVIELLLFLTERINHSFIMMGGLLQTIRKNKWYSPDYANFQLFCDSIVAIQYRKAMYLITIYESLTNNHVPFSEVMSLGYTKLVTLAPHITEDNYAMVVNWAKDMTVSEIEIALGSMEKKAKEFVHKIADASTLYPMFKETKKVIVNTNLSDLKKLILTTPINSLLDALRQSYPDKVFSLTIDEKLAA